jgi:hypothetical protein
MKTIRRFAIPQLVLVLLVTSAALSAFADPPSRAVRLQYISGPVSIQPGGVNDWVAAVVNRPLTTADRVWTDKAARAELHLGSAALRLSAETSMTLTNVSDDMVQIELDQGTLNLHIRHLFGGETYEIDTPNQAFTILKSGDYRFDVDPNADTTSVTVWRGEGEANGEGPGVKVKSGQQVTFSGGTSLQNQMASAPGLDGFDDWCRVRDDREDHAKSYQYVSADVVGADELDEYGTWRVVGAYGPVWVPAVAPGWAPYHYGHWVWVEPWGWTWVDDAPWGYAPCHYGRWVYTGGFWAWAPGPMVVARPVYAPALVAWVGGPHFGVGLSFGAGGGVGWFPLGWGEPYVPTYAVSRTYFQQVNVSNTHITNITTVTNNYYVSNSNTTVINNNIRNIHYANQGVNGAVTAVPTSAMATSQAVAKAAVAVPANAVRPESFATSAAVAPARTSVLGANATVRAAVPPAQVTSRAVVSHTAPPPKPVPFEAKQEALAKNPGRPLDTQTESQLRANVMRQAPASMNHGGPTPAAVPTAKSAAPVTPAATQPPKPGSPATPTAMESRPATRPMVGSTAPQPMAPAPTHNVPRPPQASVRPVSTNPSGSPTPPNPDAPANASRPVPRPPQPGVANAGEPHSNVASSPKPAAPPTGPRPPQNISSPNAEASNPRPPQNASRPTVQSSNPRPPQNMPRPNMQQPNPRPSAQTHPPSQPSMSHPQAQSQPHQNNQQHHTESKPEHKGDGR